MEEAICVEKCPASFLFYKIISKKKDYCANENSICIETNISDCIIC